MSSTRWRHILEIPSPDGSPLEVAYEPAWLHQDDEPINDYTHDHFEMRGLCISPTGYRSHFAIAKRVGNPVEYAKQLVAANFAERVKEGYKAGQIDLFA